MDPPEGYAVRPATADDAARIAELMNDVTVAEIGLPWTTADEVHTMLTSPGRDRALPDLLLVGADGELVGYVTFDVVADPLQIEQIASVRPELWGRGLNAWLLRLGEERARSRSSGAGGTLRVARFTGNEAAGRLFSALGYTYERTFWLMRIDLGGPTPPPAVPEGIAIRTFEPGDEIPTHTALAEGFAGHWGYSFPSFEEWRHEELGDDPAFDPSLWFLANEGEEVVGAALCRSSSPRSEDTAVVGDLAVREHWRRRGIALALLQTAFAEFRRRGIPRAELSVDAENATGATRLYERAGMREALSWEFWGKPIAGRV